MFPYNPRTDAAEKSVQRLSQCALTGVSLLDRTHVSRSQIITTIIRIVAPAIAFELKNSDRSKLQPRLCNCRREAQPYDLYRAVTNRTGIPSGSQLLISAPVSWLSVFVSYTGGSSHRSWLPLPRDSASYVAFSSP